MSALTWFLDEPVRLLAAVGLLALLMLAMRRGGAKGSAATRDPLRAFTPAQRLEIARRAGGTCEYKPMIGRRCQAPGTHADHIYPHSLGGLTITENGAWLCRGCNLRKSNKPPTALEIWRMERRRRHYFAATDSPKIRWTARA